MNCVLIVCGPDCSAVQPVSPASLIALHEAELICADRATPRDDYMRPDTTRLYSRNDRELSD